MPTAFATIDRMAPRKKSRKTDRHKPRKLMHVDPLVHEQLKLLAEQNGRPASWELRRIIVKALEENGLWPPPAPE